MCVRWAGMLIGAVIGAFSLQKYQDLSDNRGLNPKDDRWIGCWWIGYVILCIPCVFLGFLVTMFPRSMNISTPKLPEEDKMMTDFKYFEKTEIEKKTDVDNTWAGLPAKLKKLSKNYVFVFQTISQSASILSFYGMFSFNPKYLEQQFQTSASQAGLYSGIILVLAMCGGLIIGGIGLKLIKPGPRKILIYSGIVMLSVCVLQTYQSTLKCDDLLKSRVELLHQKTLHSDCGVNCECNVHQYKPICNKDTMKTYFSPCNVGCRTRYIFNNTLMYNDCECLMESSDHNMTITDGKCLVDCSKPRWIYLGIFGIMMALLGTASVGLFLVSLRSVDKKDKPFATGVHLTIFSLLAFIPSPLIFGTLFDSSCEVWDELCGKRNNCWVYNLNKMRLYFHIVPISFDFLSAIVAIVAAYFANRLKNFYDDKNEIGFR